MGNIFKSSMDMPDCEKPFSQERTVKFASASPGLSYMEMRKPDTVRVMLSEPDKQLANRQAMHPNPMQEVHNCEPAKRGRHY